MEIDKIIFENEIKDNKELQGLGLSIVENLKTDKELKNEIDNMELSVGFKKSFFKTLNLFIEHKEKNVNTYKNILINGENVPNRVFDICVNYFSNNDVCQNIKIMNYDYIYERKTDLSFNGVVNFQLKKFNTQETFKAMKTANKNLIIIAIVDNNEYQKYVDSFEVLFPYKIKNEYSIREETLKIKKLISEMGFFFY
ncbi:MAG: hypothetical protein PHQ62_00845 [Clostridia bacterium]|nr:hypothetical protein [Clostridia bacterium]